MCPVQILLGSTGVFLMYFWCLMSFATKPTWSIILWVLYASLSFSYHRTTMMHPTHRSTKPSIYCTYRVLSNKMDAHRSPNSSVGYDQTLFRHYHFRLFPKHCAVIILNMSYGSSTRCFLMAVQRSLPLITMQTHASRMIASKLPWLPESVLRFQESSQSPSPYRLERHQRATDCCFFQNRL